MAEDERTKKLEKAVKKLKAELDSQKADLQAQLQDKSALVESLKAKVEASGGEEGGDDKAGAALQEVIDEQKEQIVRENEQQHTADKAVHPHPETCLRRIGLHVPKAINHDDEAHHSHNIAQHNAQRIDENPESDLDGVI